MNTAIDHIILASANLQSLTQEVKATARIEPAIGGRLLGQGVKNNLLGLGEGQYLELLGPDPEQEEVEQPLFGLDALEAPRIIGWAVRTDDISAAAAACISAGYNPGRVREMSRKRPDGSTLQWRMTPPDQTRDSAHPFLIEWGQTPHPSQGIAGIDLLEFRLHHPEPAALSKVFAALEVLEEPGLKISQGPASSLELAVKTPAGKKTLP